MNPQRVGAVARKEFLHVIRDFRSLLMAIGTPVLLLTLFGYALTLDVDHVPLAVWDQSGTTGELLVTLPGTFQTATPVDLRGEKTGPPAKIPGGRLTFELRAYAPASFVVE